MKAHETNPTLDEIKAHAQKMRERVAEIKQRDEENRKNKGNHAIQEYLDGLSVYSKYGDMRKTDALEELRKELQFSENAETLQAVKLEKLHTELEATKAKLEDAEAEVARLELMAMEGAEALERARASNKRMRQALEMVLDFFNASTQDFLVKHGPNFGTRALCDKVREALGKAVE